MSPKTKRQTKRRKFNRQSTGHDYKKLFVIVTEGVKTEKQYFSLFSKSTQVIRVKCLDSGHGSSPKHVLRRMKKQIRKESLHSVDEAWLVVDKDEWSDEQLGELHAWTQEADNHHLALSNPCFEYWLLLHFEDGTGKRSSQARDCRDKLKEYGLYDNKSVDLRKITRERIGQAIHRARLRDTPPCIDWPRRPGCTTVYRLVENILRH